MISKHPMHVHLYQVARSDGLEALELLLDKIHALPLEHRLKSKNLNPLRLESVEPPLQGSSIWKLDFCRLRSEGPGRASKTAPAKGFDLEDGELFAEETAALYDAKSGFMALQYNHYGPRASAIAEYFSLFAAQGMEYQLLLQLDPSAQARFKQKVQFTRFAFRVAPAQLSQAWRNNNVGFLKAIEMQQKTFNADWVEVVVNLDSGSPSTLNMKDKLKSILGLASEANNAVTELKVSGRNAAGENIEVVDLLTERLEKTFTKVPLDEGRRLEQSARWLRLRDAYDKWKAAGIIQ